MEKNKIIIGLLVFIAVCVGVITFQQVSKNRAEQAEKERIEKQVQAEIESMNQDIQKTPRKARTGNW
jgi:flagellar basal body-associated protein FliL